MIRIAHIVPAFRDRITGPRNSVTSLSRALNDIGVVSCVFSTSSDEPFDWNETSVSPARLLNYRDFDYIILASLFDRRSLDVLRRIPREGPRIILSPRGSLAFCALSHHIARKAVYLGATYSKLLRRLSALHFLTEDERRSSLQFSLPSFISGNGVYFEQEHPATKTEGLPCTAGLHSDCSAGDDCPTKIGFVGRLDVNHKGLDLLIAAADRVRSGLSESGCMICLHGPDMHRGQAVIQTLLNRRGLRDIVRLGSAIEGDVKTSFLRSCDFFIHVSRYEGQPQAVQEAIFCGLPVIVSKGTNLQSLVDREQIGYTCSPTVKSISASLLEAVSSTAEQRYQMGLRARRVGRDFFEWTRCARDFVNGLASVAPL